MVILGYFLENVSVWCNSRGQLDPFGSVELKVAFKVFLIYFLWHTAEPAPKRKESIFSDDDNFLDGLGIDTDNKKKSASTPAAAATPAKARSILGDDNDNRPARSALDGLLGRGQKTASSLLETKEKPRSFVLDKKYTQPKEGRCAQHGRLATLSVGLVHKYSQHRGYVCSV